MSGKLWYPFTPPGESPILKLVRGEGSYVYDASGRRYLNGISGLWNVALGYDHAILRERAEQQIQTMAYSPLFGMSHLLAETLAERLIALSGGFMNSVYLSTTGSTAVEVAFRVARLYHRVRNQSNRTKILSFDRSYHGGSLLSLSASGLEREELSLWDSVLPDFDVIPTPLQFDATDALAAADYEENSLRALANTLEEQAERVAAVIVEPVLGSAGVVVPSTHYWRRFTQTCRRYGVLLIADEVATGCGRCGTMFASNALGLEPDILTLAKGLNSGYLPLGATLCSDAVISPIHQAGAPLLFGSTQDGNPVSCAAALATLDFITEKALFRRAIELGEFIRHELSEMMESASAVGQVRGMGLMIGMELVHRFPVSRSYSESETLSVRLRCQQEGLLVYHFASGISLFPPLTLSDSEAEELVDILRVVLSHL